jgi:RHS repeat-associated protein
LLQESDVQGKPRVNYIYLDDRPIATFDPAGKQLFFLHGNNLDAPVAATNMNQARAWTSIYQPFGYSNAGSGEIIQNLRLPGQEWDAESSTNHNGFRDYMPWAGRYSTVDPIGLAGGINNYLYVGGNPINRIDPRGLETPSVSLNSAASSNAYPHFPQRPMQAPTIQCPSTVNECATNPDFQPYFGDPAAFHCGEIGYEQSNTPSGHQQQECFYTSLGALDKGACGGSPNDYDVRRYPLMHLLSDRGGVFYPYPPYLSGPATKGQEASNRVK